MLFGDMVDWDTGENEHSLMRDMAAMSSPPGKRSVPVMVSPRNGDSAADYLVQRMVTMMMMLMPEARPPGRCCSTRSTSAAFT